MDAYAVGWRVEARAGDVVEFTYGPARWAWLVWLISALALVGAVLLVVRGRQGVPEPPPDAVRSRTGRLPWSPRTARWTAEGALCLLTLTTAGPVAGLVLTFLVIAAESWKPFWPVLRWTPLVLVLLMVVGWFVGAPSDVGPLERVEHNGLAHLLGALTVASALLVTLRTQFFGDGPSGRAPIEEPEGNP